MTLPTVGGDSFVLVLEQQPQAGVAGAELTVLIVHAEDSNGTFLPGASGNVTLSVASTGTLPAGSSPGLGGTTTRPLVAGRARFDDIRLTGAALNYRLRLSGGGSSVVTDELDIEPGTAFRVNFLDTLQTVPVGAAMPTFRVAVLDHRFDHVVQSQIERLLALVKARRVQKQDLGVLAVPDAQDAASRRLRLGSNDCELLAKNLIEEGRLPGIRTPEQRDDSGAVCPITHRRQP